MDCQHCFDDWVNMVMHQPLERFANLSRSEPRIYERNRGLRAIGDNRKGPLASYSTNIVGMGMFLRGPVNVALLTLTFYLELLDSAYAYLDPGTGSILLQGLIGAVVSGWVAVRLYWGKLMAFLSVKHSCRTQDQQEASKHCPRGADDLDKDGDLAYWAGAVRCHRVRPEKLIQRSCIC
jgi:hypothetical protein